MKSCWWITKTTCFGHLELDCSHKCGFANVRGIMTASESINEQLNESAKLLELLDEEETVLNFNTLQKTPTSKSVKHNNQGIFMPDMPAVLVLSPHSQTSATSRATGFFQPMSRNNNCICPINNVCFAHHRQRMAPPFLQLSTGFSHQSQAPNAFSRLKQMLATQAQLQAAPFVPNPPSGVMPMPVHAAVPPSAKRKPSKKPKPRRQQGKLLHQRRRKNQQKRRNQPARTQLKRTN